MTQVLLLGGTFDAHVLSNRLHAAGISGIYSFAGATQSRREQALPTRVGGFGGIDGLTKYLQAHRISHVIDATHPFAAQMSRHAIEACKALGIPLLSMERPAWQAMADDQWTHVPDMEAAAKALQSQHRHVFLAIGRKQLPVFVPLSELHHFVLRVVDEPQAPLLPAPHELIVARGPFQLQDELALLRTHAIDCIVSKNAGGQDTYAKIEAARQLRLPVIMVNRPSLPERTQCATPEEAMQWLRGRL
ncbi:cobalt-precorrin-6A reductase [Diaphorobacter caeni]|uniref:cobalt-precorrin-6A reductase n=1 Tax=Diaphorobacter caeni TaxID=2784387 RepID=UPI00189063A3|nr:cobalt-precorrin-6A reductase [Diaphorobacter caeni]MBF5006287.1 cobalt-precorrin-6A reductase [Diaphorobacter caeni]